MTETLKQTPLFDLHIEHGAKMVGFAGYEMPVQYADMGVMKEHLHTRNQAGVFDVSHMGQVFISGETDPAIALEAIIPSDLRNQKIGQMRYTVLLNDQGGIIDDLIVTRTSNTSFYIVLNAARIDADIPRLKTILGDAFTFNHDTKRVLIAVQGPKATEAITPLFPTADQLGFMQSAQQGDIIISRCGYTGEDGFELSIPTSDFPPYIKSLLDLEFVKLIGLGARDSLRLEAGLCLYGHDLNENITPTEASLNWVIQKSRRTEADFLGVSRILGELKNGATMKRIGLLPEGRAPLREGVELVNDNGDIIGHITSGTFSPCLERPIAMGYIKTAYAKNGDNVNALLRGKTVTAKIVKMPFIESNTKKG